MNDLGRIEDLPPDYVQDLRNVNLVPLWPSLRGVLPPKVPTRQTQPTCWAYKDIKPLLLKAGELTPIEKAERRVLVLANPGHGLDKMQASAAMYLGMQLLMPGEWAPSHRHTPNAVRMVVEGEGAWTTVDGEKCPMSLLHGGQLPHQRRPPGRGAWPQRPAIRPRRRGALACV
jgi:gentisate 1,2-dioxygenase